MISVFLFILQCLYTCISGFLLCVVNFTMFIYVCFQITIFEQDNTMKLREFEVKLQSTEDVNRSTNTQLRKLLTAQQRMSARYVY